MKPAISAIVMVSERYDAVKPLYEEYKEAMRRTGETFQFIYVLDGSFPEVSSDLNELRDAGEDLQVVELGKWYGESTALTIALRYADGAKIVTLPAYAQVGSSGLEQLVAELDNTDVVLAVRNPRRDSGWNRFQAGVFRKVINLVSGSRYRDLGCGVRAFRRAVFDEIPVYGDLHRFIPLLSSRAGFRVKEVELPQSDADLGSRVYRPGVYLRRMLDILTIIFLVRFTKKPLRFFGILGATTAGAGGLVMVWLVIERLFFDVALGDRPALLLGTLLFAIGVQLVAVGLIGELIIFTHATNVKEYAVERVAQANPERPHRDSD